TGKNQVLLEPGMKTPWSRYGIGQWVQFDMDTAAGPPTIEAIEITFYKGDTRVQKFEVRACLCVSRV
ncbi:unnamed protein product, partial [Sphacelaria rigidula]